MPVIEKSTYRAPFLLRNNHLQTIIPTLFRKVDGVNYTRQRIETPDGDFIDIDCSCAGSDRAVVLSHGLEGNSGRAYMLGMVKAFNKRGWDGIAFNFRGCSGEPNLKPETYHSGKTEDLHCVIDHLLSSGKYKTLSLVGFSLGGNLTLKYAGEHGRKIYPEIKSAVGISVPCDLTSSSVELHRKKNFIYSKRFLIMLIEKMRDKEQTLPHYINRDFSSVKTLKNFDDNFTGPLNGFRDAAEYWQKCSSKNFISEISIPALIINAADDPILGKECFPYDQARNSNNLYLEVPANGGHMGFITRGNGGEYWHESRTIEFVENQL
jgi:hypothetical protein